MKKYFLVLTAAMILFTYNNVYGQVSLKRSGNAIFLSVKNSPMLVLGGETGNSEATSVEDIRNLFGNSVLMNTVNTLFVPVMWDMTEPEENHFDFSLIDETIKQARGKEKKIIFLWFGAWKNSMSCYAPAWVKKDTGRFPRAVDAAGNKMEIVTVFSDNLLAADKKAFCKVLAHIHDVDNEENTVIMMQIENEIGMLGAARDHCPLAEKAFAEWQKSGLGKKFAYKENLESDAQDELFQTYYYARYVEQMAVAGKKCHDIPMFVNTALDSRGRKPGDYPSAGPLAKLMHVWKKTAPHVDVIAPDIYDKGFKSWLSQYHTANNPFFTPETQFDASSGVKALYTFGEEKAMGYSVFSVEKISSDESLHSLTGSYMVLKQMSPLLLSSLGKKKSWGLLFDGNESGRTIADDNDMEIECSHYSSLSWGPNHNDKSKWQETGGLIIKLAEDDYFIAGEGIVAKFKSKKNNTGILSVDEVTVSSDESLNFVRRLNGDEDHQGRQAMIPCGKVRLLHVKLYHY